MENLTKYRKGKIYMIVDNTNENRYIGATYDTLERKLANHRYSYNQYCENRGFYTPLYEIMVNDDYEIILLEECEDCYTKQDLQNYKDAFIRVVTCVNKNEKYLFKQFMNKQGIR